jgi:hypothetical protein
MWQAVAGAAQVRGMIETGAGVIKRRRCNTLLREREGMFGLVN